MNIDAEIWSIKAGEIVELKADNRVFEIKKEPVVKDTSNSSGFKQKQKTYARNKKISYLEKWINNNNFEVFTLDQFFSAYPKQSENRKLDGIISRLVTDKKITQLGKNKFKVM